MAGINKVNVGRDVSLSVQTSTGALAIDITTAFDAKPRFDLKRSRPLNGRPKSIPIPDGWGGSIEIDRTTNDVEAFFADVESGYFAGNGIAPGTISETIVNAADGSVSVYQYTEVMLIFKDAGKKQADDLIKMSIDFEASGRDLLI